MPYSRPSPADLDASRDRTVPDVIAPTLNVLFCGINPSLYSAAVGHHFARPGNRFWPTLEASGFTPRRLQPWEDIELPRYGCGITNVVARASAAAAELSKTEIHHGAHALRRTVRHYRPRVLAVLGIGVYRTAFAAPRAGLGLQIERIGDTALWVLPNPSGLNAHFQLPQLAELFRELREFALD